MNYLGTADKSSENQILSLRATKDEHSRFIFLNSSFENKDVILDDKSIECLQDNNTKIM